MCVATQVAAFGCHTRAVHEATTAAPILPTWRRRKGSSASALLLRRQSHPSLAQCRVSWGTRHRRAATRTPQCVAGCVHQHAGGCQRSRGAEGHRHGGRCTGHGGCQSTRAAGRAQAASCAPRRPTTLPAAAPPQAPFHTSLLPRRLSATHCGRRGDRGHPGRVSGPTSLGLFCAPGAARQGTHVHGRKDAADGSKGSAGGAHAARGGQERRHRLALQAFGHVLCGGARVSCCGPRREATRAVGSRTVQVAVIAPSRAPMAALEPRADSTRKTQPSGLLPTSPMVGAKQSERGSGGVAPQRVKQVLRGVRP